MTNPVPSYVSITPYLASMMRLESSRQLVHTYSRTPRSTTVDTDTGDPATDPGIDDWGQPVRFTGPTVDNLPCFFQHDRSVQVTPEGLVQLDQPVLTVDSADQLQPGDVVTNVQTLPDTVNNIPPLVILIGPYVVESIAPQDPYYGATLFNQAVLRQLEIVPNEYTSG